MKVSCLAWLAGLMFLAASAPAWAAAPVPQPARPNFVFILIDDMGYGDLGCYGNTTVKTPNIDRLAAAGVRFTQFHVNSPICSPSRVAFTTGQYPQRWRITSFIAARKENENRGMAQWLAPEAPSVARILKSAGYRTAHVGKWHMGGGRDVGEAPLITEYGFDESLTQFEGLGDRLLPTFDTLFPNQPNRAMGLGVASAKLGRGKTEFVKRHEITPRYVARAIEFIKSARDAKQPFYVNLWLDDVHSPHEPSPASRGDGSPQAMYDGVVAETDAALGPLLDLVRDDEQLAASTIVVFASDNGHEPSVRNAAGLRGHKGTLYQGGLREPFIVAAPGVKPSTNDVTVMTGIDLPPTLLKLASVEVLSDVKFDGQDLSPAFRGDQPQRAGPLFFTRPPDRPGPQGSLPDLAVRDGAWKLLIEEDASNPQLYDVLVDPMEQSNVADQHPDVVKNLQSRLFDWRNTLPR